MRTWLEAFASLAILAACSGDGPALQLARPIIFVCPAVDSPAGDCNGTFELGELPVTLAHAFELFVLNRGEGPLVVLGIESSERVLVAAELPLAVPAGGAVRLSIALTPAALGAGREPLVVRSDDPARGTLEVTLAFTGVPKPSPSIELCVEADRDTCGVDLAVDFGEVRPTQRESATVRVRNRGTAKLRILEVRIEGATSIEGELAFATSTRPGELDPGAEAPVVLVYEPRDAGADEALVRFVSDDEGAPSVRVVVRGARAPNAPPLSTAVEAGSGRTSVGASVGDTVALDGSASTDPEGDPLTFEWTLAAPQGSRASLDDPAAVLTTFSPDVRGLYRAELVVRDSLGQPSEVAAAVLVEARLSFGLRVELEWTRGGDLDLHLVRAGGTLFSADDCYFENPSPDFGALGVRDDDPVLNLDASAAPGREEIAIVAPEAGRYRVYAHYFDAAGGGPADARARVVFNDAGGSAFVDTETLPDTCALWYVGDAVFPDGTFSPSGTQVTDHCR